MIADWMLLILAAGFWAGGVVALWISARQWARAVDLHRLIRTDLEAFDLACQMAAAEDYAGASRALETRFKDEQGGIDAIRE